MSSTGVKISDRLLRVASYVKSKGIVADIGCDHGFTSIYLVQNGLARGAVAADINKKPLAKAEKNIREYGLSEKISVRLSDGAKGLKEGEIDTILISGMGGALITKILGESLEVVNSSYELVLSPQSEVHLVRRFLHRQGFKITDEAMVYDKNKYYVIIRAVKGFEEAYSECEYIYGKLLADRKDEIFKRYLLKEKKRIEKILPCLTSENLSGKALERKLLLEDEYNMITKVLGNMGR